MLYYKRLLVCLFLVCCLSAPAQNLQQRLDSFSGSFIAAIQRQDKPQAQLVTDKSIFKAGETLWFRAFLIHAVSQKVYTKTRYLFVDLVNAQDSVVAIAILDAANQQLSGQIAVPAALSPGYYWLRAYTKQMAEADTASCAIKPIYIIGKDNSFRSKTSVSKTAASARTPVINFYPEGGAIMTRVNSAIGVMIQGPDQKPMAAQGYVKDNRDSIVARFQSNTFGLGKFDFFPSPFRKYKAYLDGSEASYPLPPFNFHAGQIAVTKRAAGMLTLRVLLEDSVYTDGVVTYVIGVNKDQLYFAGIGRGLYELNVPEQKFPEGIATFYLFDSAYRFLSERSVYINGNQTQVKASVDKDMYGKRDKVALTISVADAEGKAVSSLFAVAVADSAFMNPADGCAVSGGIDWHPNMPSNLQCLAEPDADLAMLMRSNSYQNKSRIIDNPSPGNDDSLLFIKGQAMDEKNNPAAYKILTLFSDKEASFFAMDTTDETGRFSIPVSNYRDSTRFVVEAKDRNGKSVRIKILRDPIPLPRFATPISLKQYFPAEPVFTARYRQAYLDNTFAGAGKSLPSVTVRGKKEAAYNQLKRVNSSSTIITSDQLDERRSVGDIILTVGGMHMLQGFLVINGLTAMKAPDAGSEPLLLIDGVQASYAGSMDESPVISTLNSINPKDIDFIEILKGPEGANYGVRGGNGVILVNMLSSRREIYGTVSNLQTFYGDGISRSVLFPVNNYENSKLKSTESFDNRSTIFWDGAVLTSADKEVRLQFFTSDIPTTYKVIVSGITVRGDMIYKTLTFYTK